MRLVIDGHRLTAQRTGVGRCLESLLAEWAQTGWPADETVLVLRDRAGLNRVPRSAGLETVVVGERWPGLISETFGLGRVLRKDDLLFAPANLVPLTWRGPTVLIIHDTLSWSVPDSFPWHARLRFNWRYRLAARRARRLIVPSEATRLEVERVHGIAPHQIDVVPLGVDSHFQFAPPNGPEVEQARQTVDLGDAPYFLFVGKRSRRRHVPALLEAFAKHRQAFPLHRLVFIGPDGSNDLPDRETGVIAGGHVDEETLRGLLSGAIALLYPSDYEGFGLPIIEAMACGCPVVTSRNSALIESGGDAAIFLADHSVDEMARALDRLAKDHSFRTHRIEAGRLHAPRFDRASFAHQVKQILRRCIETS